MKPTPKADLCVKMIGEIALIVYTLKHLNGDKYTSAYIDLFKKKDKLESLLSSEREKLDNLKKRVNQLYFICGYRLMPLSSIKHNGKSSFIGKGEDVKEELRSVLIEKKMIKPEEFDDFWCVVTIYDEVTTDDLKAEFWEVSDNIESFDKSYQMIRLKYKEVLSYVPDSACYDYFKQIKDSKIISYIEYVVKYKIAERKEIEDLIFRICNVVEWLNMSIKRIGRLYKSFIADNDKPDANTSVPQLPKILDTPEIAAIFTKAIEAGLMERQDGVYKWIVSDRECVYFARCININIWGKLGQSPKNRRKYKNEMMRWKPFEELFNKKNFAQEWTKIEREECDYPNVDKAFVA